MTFGDLFFLFQKKSTLPTIIIIIIIIIRYVSDISRYRSAGSRCVKSGTNCYPMLSHAIPCYPIACNQYLESKCDWLLDEIHFASDRAAVVTDGATISQGRRCTGTGSRSKLLFGIWQHIFMFIKFS